MKKITCFLITTILLLSCSLSSDDTPYHNFSKNDLQHIPTHYENVGKVIKFKNETGDEVSFEVSYYSLNKLSNSGAPYYYYDVLNCGIKFLSNPSDYNKIVINIKKDYENRLKIEVGSRGNLFTYSSPFENLQTMEINNIIYDKVKIIPIRADLFEDFEIEKMVYDLKKGIIGFNLGLNVVNQDVSHYRIMD